MRRIAVMNQKGGVGKTTTTANLGAALALQGRRVVLVDMDAQANLSLSLNVEAAADAPSSYTVLLGSTTFEEALRPTSIPLLRLIPSHLDLSGAELELAGTIGREYVMRDAMRQWAEVAGSEPADYVLFDCPPSLGLLSINALAAAKEVLITLQTEFLALQGMSKLVDVVQLLRRRLNPELVITGILPCLYDSRLKLAREVLGEIRAYFPGQVLPKPVRSSVKLAEAPSYGRTIFEYAPESHGAQDYMQVAREIIRQESRDPALAGLPPFDERITAAARQNAATTATPTSRNETPPSAPLTSATHASTKVETAPEAPAARPAPTRKRAVTTPVPNEPEVQIPAAHASAAVEPAIEAPAARPAAMRKRAVITPTPREPSVQIPAAQANAAIEPASDAPMARPVPMRKRAVITPTPNEPAVQAPSAKRKRLPVVEVLPAPKPAPKSTPVAANQRTPRASQAGARAAPEPARTPRDTSGEQSARPASSADSPTPIPRASDRDTASARRTSRADDFPPLPPDAFEILSSFGRE